MDNWSWLGAMVISWILGLCYGRVGYSKDVEVGAHTHDQISAGEYAESEKSLAVMSAIRND